MIGADELDARARAPGGASSSGCARASSSPTAEPYAALCYGCPAAARLCPHPSGGRRIEPARGLRLRLAGQPGERLADARPAGRSRSPPACGAGRAPGRSPATTRPRRRPSPAPTAPSPPSASGSTSSRRRAGAAPERGPDRTHRGRARTPRPARDPLPPGRGHRFGVRGRPARRGLRPRLSPTSRVPSTTARPRRPTRSSSPATRRRSRPRSTRSARASSICIRATTAPPPVEVTEATLVRDRIPPGNPRGW